MTGNLHQLTSTMRSSMIVILLNIACLANFVKAAWSFFSGNDFPKSNRLKDKIHRSNGEFVDFGDLWPTQYNLTLDLSNDDLVHGYVIIFTECLRDTDLVHLYAEFMHIESIRVDKDTPRISGYQHSNVGFGSSNRVRIVETLIGSTWELGAPEPHYLRIKLAKKMEEDDKYIIRIKFNYPYSSTNRGLRRSPLRNLYGNASGLLTTNFKPIYARRVFPCFDMPWFKSIYHLEIKTKLNYTVKMITPHHFQSTDTSTGDKKSTRISIEEPTPTNELDFIVYDSQIWLNISSLNNQGGELIIKNNSRWDMVLTETDVYWTANTDTAEHIGSRNLLGLCKSDSDTNLNQTKIFGQEFQDSDSYFTWEFLTQKTMMFKGLRHDDMYPIKLESWKHLWFKLGMIYLTEYVHAADNYEDHKLLMEMFVVSKQIKSMSDDLSLIPIILAEEPISTPEVMKKFDESTLIKAAAFIRTMFLIGSLKKNFLDRLKVMFSWKDPNIDKTPEEYFKDFESSNVTLEASLFAIDALLDEMKIVRNFWEVIDAWTKYPGYQVISANRVKNGTTLELSFSNIQPKTGAWLVIKVFGAAHSKDYPQNVLWMKSNGHYDTKHISLDPKEECFHVNNNYYAYYRVMYDEDTWNNINNCLGDHRRELFQPMTRAHIIDDAFAFSKGGHLSYNTTLRLMKTLTFEVDIVPWIAVYENLKYIDTFMISHYESEGYMDFKRNLYHMMFVRTKHGQKLEVKKNDTQVVRSKRMLILRASCAAEMPECQDFVDELFLKALDDPGFVIHPDFQFIVHCFGMKNSNESVWDRMMFRYGNASSLAAKLMIAESLGCSRDHNVVDKVFEWILSNESPLMFDENIKILQRLIETKDDVFVKVLRFINDNKDQMEKLINRDGIRILIESLSKRLINWDHIASYKKFIEYWISQRILTRTLDHDVLKTADFTFKSNQDWVIMYGDDVVDWFDEASNWN